MLTFIGKEAGDNWESWKDSLHYVDYVGGGGNRDRHRLSHRRGRRRRKRDQGAAGTDTATESA